MAKITSVFQIAADEDGNRLLLRARFEDASLKYCLCDTGFRVLETIPDEEVIMDYRRFGERGTSDIPWRLQITGRRVTLQNLFSGEEYSFEVPAEDSSQLRGDGVIARYGDILLLSLPKGSLDMLTACISKDGSVHFIENVVIKEKEDFLRLGRSGDNVSWFYDMQGHYLGGGEGIEYISPDGSMRAVRRGSYLYVESIDQSVIMEDELQPGKELYLRILAADEEQDELKSGWGDGRP